MAKNQLTKSQLDAIRTVFDTFDTNGDGSVSITELDEVMRKMGRSISAQDLNQKMAMLDTDGSGKLEFDEFIEIAADVFLAPWTDIEIEQSFKMFDEDGSGKISADELRQVARTSGIGASDAELEAMIKAADTDGDGQVNYNEFYKIMKT